jgi:hypothetical protein
VSELDKRIENVLLQRLSQIIKVWCTEFDRTEDLDLRRDAFPLREKRRGEKRVKEEKVSAPAFVYGSGSKLALGLVFGGQHGTKTYNP